MNLFHANLINDPFITSVDLFIKHYSLYIIYASNSVSEKVSKGEPTDPNRSTLHTAGITHLIIFIM